MRYSLEFQEKAADFAKKTSVKDASKAFHVRPEIIQGWLVKDMDEVKLRLHIQQKFYNLIPVMEAKVTTAYSDFVVCSITDEEWEDLSNQINRVIVDTVTQVYKATLEDPLFIERKPEKKKPSPEGQPTLFDMD